VSRTAQLKGVVALCYKWLPKKPTSRELTKLLDVEFLAICYARISGAKQLAKNALRNGGYGRCLH